MINVISERINPRLTFDKIACGETILRDGTYFIKIQTVETYNGETRNAVWNMYIRTIYRKGQ